MNKSHLLKFFIISIILLSFIIPASATIAVSHYTSPSETGGPGESGLPTQFYWNASLNRLPIQYEIPNAGMRFDASGGYYYWFHTLTHDAYLTGTYKGITYFNATLLAFFNGYDSAYNRTVGADYIGFDADLIYFFTYVNSDMSNLHGTIPFNITVNSNNITIDPTYHHLSAWFTFSNYPTQTIEDNLGLSDDVYLGHGVMTKDGVHSLTYSGGTIPPFSGQFDLTLNKTSVQMNEGVGGTLDTNLNAFTRIEYYQDYIILGSREMDPSGVGINAQFRETGGQWFAINSGRTDYDVLVSNNTVLHLNTAFSDPGLHNIYVFGYDSNGFLIANDTKQIDILGGNKFSTDFQITDADTGAYINNAYLKVYSITKSVTNFEGVVPGGDISLTFDAGEQLSLDAGANRYYNFTVGYAQGFGNNIYHIALSPIVNVSPGNALIKFRVYDSTGQTDPNNPVGTKPINNAKITITGTGVNIVNYTSSAGACNIEVPGTGQFTYLVESTGFKSQTFSFTPVVPWSYAYIYLNPISGTITPTTVPTPNNGGVGWWNLLALFGITDIPTQKATTGIFICLSFAAILGYITRDSGSAGLSVMIGGGMGFVYSTYLGFFPIWILIAAIVIFGIIYGAKIAGSGGD